MKTRELLFFLASQLLIPVLPELPDWRLLVGLSLLPILCWRFPGIRNALIACLLGAWLATYLCQSLVNSLLPPHYENVWLQVNGTVDSLPVVDGRKIQFRLRVDTLKTFPNTDAADPVAFHVKSVLLNYYPPVKVGSPEYEKHMSILLPGQVIVAKVKLKRLHGLINPRGFNYEAWLLAEGIHAVGYLKTYTLTTNAPDQSSACLPIGAGFDCLRLQLGQWLEESERKGVIQYAGLLRALLIGDKSRIGSAQWDTLVTTGTVHLLVISGLHIGFMATIGWLVGLLVGRILLCGGWCMAYLLYCFGKSHLLGRMEDVYSASVRSFLPLPYLLAVISSLIAAGFYSQLAGFGVATQRALVMLGLYYLTIVLRRSVSPSRFLLLAGMFVLLLDPMAGYRVGFWLSFGIVGILLFGLSARFDAGNALTVDSSSLMSSIKTQVLQYLGTFGRVQWLIFLGMLCPLLLLLDQLALIAPLANVVAVPLVSFVVVPALMGAAVCHSLMLSQAGAGVGEFLLSLANGCLDILWRFLSFLEDGTDKLATVTMKEPWFSGVMATLHHGNHLALTAGFIGSLWLLLPRGWPAKRLGFALLILGWLFIYNGSSTREFRVQVLDVGQGLAVVVLDGAHTLVFDTGARFSDRFDIGANVIGPYLRRTGVDSLDKIIISHGDWDHSSGLPGLLKQVPAAQVLSGEADKVANANPCVNGLHWQWGARHYQLLKAHYDETQTVSGNNASCSLLIEGAGQRVLITGDIERSAEDLLLADGRLPRDIDVLVAPHHGSKTSSSLPFVLHLSPKHVVFSSGYFNRYGHPHAEVVKRYEAARSRVWLTSRDGAVEFRWVDQRLSVTASRVRWRKFWYLPTDTSE